jgi:hypothetical protein
MPPVKTAPAARILVAANVLEQQRRTQRSSTLREIVPISRSQLTGAAMRVQLALAVRRSIHCRRSTARACLRMAELSRPCTGKFDHLRPFFRFFGKKPAEAGGRPGKADNTDLGEGVR